MPNFPMLMDLLTFAFTASIGSIVVMALDESLCRHHLSFFANRAMGAMLLGGGFWGVIIGARWFPHMAQKRGFWAIAIFIELLWLVFVLPLAF